MNLKLLGTNIHSLIERRLGLPPKELASQIDEILRDAEERGRRPGDTSLHGSKFYRVTRDGVERNMGLTVVRDDASGSMKLSLDDADVPAREPSLYVADENGNGRIDNLVEGPVSGEWLWLRAQDLNGDSAMDDYLGFDGGDVFEVRDNNYDGYWDTLERHHQVQQVHIPIDQPLPSPLPSPQDGAGR